MAQIEKWQKDLEVYRNISTTFVIEGNVHDLQPWFYETDGDCELMSLSRYLHQYLTGGGYKPVVFYNRIDGFHEPYASDMTDTFFRLTGSNAQSTRCIGDAMDAIRRAMTSNVQATAVVLDLANTLSSAPDDLSDEEIEYFTRLMLASCTTTQGTGTKGQPLNNLLFLVVEKVNDLPAWFYLNNPYVRILTISRPEKEVREMVVSARLDSIRGAKELGADERQQAVELLTALTDGMTLVELSGIFSLCFQRAFSVGQLREAVKLFRFGEIESQWDKLDRDKMQRVEEFLSRRVKGQPAAVYKAAEVLSRAYLGMSGIQGGSPSRPRGILFLAGPTGTGKTELAKTIAEFVFGDERFMTRFDMSEYQQPHSDQKLLGAPPGYIGYSAGGQLTNAIKARPFCVLLFDEIEKAHPSILDKFLQILEDGRLTDSAGETVYFSEALIVFTSNLGLVEEERVTGTRRQTVRPDMGYDKIQESLLGAIRNYFKYTIQRPELLNRIGDNLVVFDFVRADVAKEILEVKLDAVAKNLEREKGLHLEISDEFRAFLQEQIDLSNGGRGVGNAVDSCLIDPLSHILVRERWAVGDTLVIQDRPGAAEAPPIYQLKKAYSAPGR